MHDQTFLVFLRINLPDFFNANAVVLGVFTFIQRKMGDQLFAEVSPAALSEDRVAGVELHTGDVAVFLSAIGTDAHFTGSNAFDRPCIVKQHLRGRETGVDFYA